MYSVEVANALPYFGVEGVRALLTIDPDSKILSHGSAVARQMGDHVDADTRIKVLEFLLSRGEAIEGLDRIASQAAGSTDMRVRGAAGLLLANLAPDSKQATDALLHVLGGTSRRLRSYAIKALAKQAKQPRVRAYLSWLQFDEDERVAEVAKKALR